MAEYELSAMGVRIGAPSRKELIALLGELPELLERLKEAIPASVQTLHAPQAASVQPSSAGAMLDPTKGGPNCEAFQALFGKRFRMTNEESELYGDNRELAAYHRLKASPRHDLAIEVPNVTPGATQAAPKTSKGVSLDLANLGDLGGDD